MSQPISSGPACDPRVRAPCGVQTPVAESGASCAAAILNPDVCIVHNLRAAARPVLENIYPNAVITMHYHGGELPGVPVPPPTSCRRSAFNSFDVVFTNTQNSREHAISRGTLPRRVVISQVGFDATLIKVSQSIGGKLNVLMVGRLSEEKGFLFGLQALRVR